MSEKIRIKILSGDDAFIGEFDSGITLLSAIRQSGLSDDHHLHTPCAGKGTCGKCLVRATGALDAISEEEKKLISADDLASGYRLSCRAKAVGDAEITYDSTSEKSADIAVSAQSGAKEYPLSPISNSNYGIAVDIGTTTVAVYLVNLKSGEIIDTRAFMNPQSEAGSDVISRIQYTTETDGGKERLASLISDAISAATLSLVESASISRFDISVMTIAGNTVMEHFIAAIDARSIAAAPFDAPSLFGEFCSADKLGLANCMSENARVYLAPCVASYVGGDLTAGTVAAGLKYMSGNHLFIDIGTNGEMGLLSEGKITFCATAAGPAFEGAHIKCGMSGLPGAIRGVTLTDGGAITLSTIGDAPPKGICGSGIIDAAAVFLKLGLIDETGCILCADEVEGDYADLENLTEFADEDGETLYFGEDKTVYLTGADIREIQLAKSAVSAGVMTLLSHRGVDIASVDSVMLAGGFGSKIDPGSACDIGLIPSELRGKIRALGNTAGNGAVMMLLSNAALADAEETAKTSEYLELSCNSYFMEEFVERMMFQQNK